MTSYETFSTMFVFDEKILLNKMALDLSLRNCLDRLALYEEVTSDEECKQLIVSLQEKVKILTEEEWEDLKSFLPFDLPLTEEDLESGSNQDFE